jgi:hypothetical protein
MSGREETHVTETQWLTEDEPAQMLHDLRIADKLNERKLRLFTVGVLSRGIGACYLSSHAC